MLLFHVRKLARCHQFTRRVSRVLQMADRLFISDDCLRVIALADLTLIDIYNCLDRISKKKFPLLASKDKDRLRVDFLGSLQNKTWESSWARMVSTRGHMMACDRALRESRSCARCELPAQNSESSSESFRTRGCGNSVTPNAAGLRLARRSPAA
jgi:hypothetical protein